MQYTDELCRASGAAGPFAREALRLLDHNLAPIPLDGKAPVIRSYSRWTAPPSRAAVEQWRRQHGHRNLGVATGRASGVTVLDLDGTDAAQIVETLDTPLVIRTARGFHAWFKWYREGNANLRPSLNADLKGQGGVVAAPPSVHESGTEYALYRGSWADVRLLPELPDRFRSFASNRQRGGANTILKGERNNRLFGLLLRDARHSDSIEQVMDCARNHNDALHEPLPDAEIVRTAQSAWSYEARGMNLAGRARFGVTTLDEILGLASWPDAVLLLSYLRAHHTTTHIFSVSPKALARRFDWGDHTRVARARDRLVNGRRLVCLHKGGTKRGDKSSYRLTDPFVMKEIGRGGNPAPIERTCSPPVDSPTGIDQETDDHSGEGRQ